MKSLLFTLIPASLFLLGCSTTGSSTRATKGEQLAGIWDCDSAVVDGRTLPTETVKLLRLTLTQDRYKTQKGDEVLFDSTYAVDVAQSPKRISMVGTEGDLAGKEALGIYALEGDTLRMCYTMPGRPRPLAFESPAGSGAYMVVWHRRKP